MHFFNPVPLMALVEVISGLATSPAVADCIDATAKAWGKLPVRATSTPGFIVNRVARPFYAEALRLLLEQAADPASIDAVMRESGGFRMGPFELMDFIGHDVNYRVTETVWQQMFYDARYRPSLIQKRLFESGLYGKKTGRGYYLYENDNRVAQEVNPDLNLQSGIFERVMVMLFNEALEALYLGIAAAEDLDKAMMKGVNYPQGLISWAQTWGHAKVLSKLEELHFEYGDDRYRPSVMLRKMVRGA
jgi:3-hydroxybutyryl-CoA dehydrogenase